MSWTPALSALLWLLAVTAGRAQFAYSEPLRLEWGEVNFASDDAEDTEETWFARASPTFVLGASFTPTQCLCLSNAFLTATGRFSGQLVWRINTSTLRRFRQIAQDESCLDGGDFSDSGSPPDDWESGPTTRDWEFSFGYTRPTSIRRTLELALLAEDVPSGIAWEVSLPVALADPQILARAELPAGAQETVRACGQWARLFLVSPASFSKGRFSEPADFPTVEPIPDLGPQRVPVAFGLRALAEIVSVFGEDRSFRTSTLDSLRARLSPDQPQAFPGAGRWFPEPDTSRRALEVTWLQTGVGQDQLLRVAYPSGGAFETPRVLPATNEWAVRVGPFRRLQSAQARVGRVQGVTQTHDVTTLPTLLTNQPVLLRHYQHDIRDLETEMADKLRGSGPATDEYFWLPDWTNAPALKRRVQLVRSLEKTRFVQAVSVGFLTNRFVYDAVYVPAEIQGKVGASYNPTQRLGLEAEGGWKGLVRPGDNLQVKATVAERLRTGDLNYSLPYHRSLDRRTTFHLEALGDVGRDESFRLGSFSSSPFQHDHRAGGLAHQIHHSADAWDWQERDQISWDVHTLEPSGSAMARDDAGLLIHHEQTWRFAPVSRTNAPVRWEYWVIPSLDLAPQVGWQEAFVRGELSAGARASFGGKARDAMYVSLRGSYGCASANLPPVLYFRLGEAQRLFGLEPGEFSGRSYVHGEAAYGLNLRPLLAGLFRGTNAAAPAPPFLEGLHLQTLAEVGAFSQTGSLQAATQPDRVLSSFGVALEKAAPALGRGAGFRVGYAWSPDSFRRHGRLFTTLSWSF